MRDLSAAPPPNSARVIKSGTYRRPSRCRAGCISDGRQAAEKPIVKKSGAQRRRRRQLCQHTPRMSIGPGCEAPLVYRSGAGGGGEPGAMSIALRLFWMDQDLIFCGEAVEARCLLQPNTDTRFALCLIWMDALCGCWRGRRSAKRCRVKRCALLCACTGRRDLRGQERATGPCRCARGRRGPRRLLPRAERVLAPQHLAVKAAAGPA